MTDRGQLTPSAAICRGLLPFWMGGMVLFAGAVGWIAGALLAPEEPLLVMAAAEVLQEVAGIQLDVSSAPPLVEPVFAVLFAYVVGREAVKHYRVIRELEERGRE